MSSPFFIWTMQRTGGTSLTELLMDMSEHCSAEHEPFNWHRAPRQFGYVARDWHEHRDEAGLTKCLTEIFGQNHLIKHCYELHPMDLNIRLMGLVPSRYKHMHLLRHDEFSRLVSRFVAEANGTWFKDYAREVYDEIQSGRRQLAPLRVDEVVRAYEASNAYKKKIRAWMSDYGVAAAEVYYEDIYTGEKEERLARLHALFDYLGFDAGLIDAFKTRIDEKIFGSGQNTSSVLQFIPNLDEVREALIRAGYDENPG